MSQRLKTTVVYLGAVLLLIGGFVAGGWGAIATLIASSGVVAVMGDTVETTDLTEAMKIIFGDSLINNVVTDSELLDIFEEGSGIKTDQTTGGRYIETAQLFNLPAGVGARGESGYIPVPRGPLIKNSRIELKKILGSVEMSGDVLKRVRTDIGAFVNWGEQSMPKLVERLRNEMDRMLLGYGSGVKARVNAATPATNLIVDSAFGVAGLGGALFQFQKGETIRAATTAAGTTLRANKMVVEDVDHANGYMVVDALSTALADNDFLAEGDEADNSFGKEPMGLLGIVDDGDILATFQNLARATYSAWRGHVFDAQAAPFAAGQKLTEEVVVYADDTSYQRGGAMIDLFVTSRDGLRTLWKDLKGDRSFNDPRSFTGGKGGIFMVLGDRTVPVRVARKMPPSLAFGITRGTLKKWMLKSFEWDDTTGSLFRQVTDSTGRKDAFYAYGTTHLETGSEDPQKNFRIENFDNSLT
jgi:hypothetical protein